MLLLISCGKSNSTAQETLSSDIDVLSFSSTSLQMPANTTLFNRFLTKGDIDGDGLVDLIMGGVNHNSVMSKVPVVIFKNNGNGSLTDITASKFSSGQIPELYQAQGFLEDLNGDSVLDLVLFDLGIKTRGLDGGYLGGKPYLFLSQPANSEWISSTSIETSIENYRMDILNDFSQTPLSCGGEDKYYYNWHGGNDCDAFSAGDGLMAMIDNGAIHSKYQDLADFDNDGDIDIFIEAGGGTGNVKYNMFLLNDGSGQFTYDLSRTDEVYLRNSNNTGPMGQPGSWRHFKNKIVDIDGDGFKDLVMGKLGNSLGSNNWDTDSLFNKIFINDGSHNYPASSVIELPNPKMMEGDPIKQYATAAGAMDFDDLNNDGLLDIVIAHSRGTDGDALGSTSWTSTGRYIQVLHQKLDGNFTDVTDNYLPDQSVYSQETIDFDFYPDDPIISGFFQDNDSRARELILTDFDNDGDKDIVLERIDGNMHKDLVPVVYLRNSAGFQPTNFKEFQYPNIFYFVGSGLAWLDLNQDQKLDAVIMGWYAGDLANPQSEMHVFIQ